MDFKSKAAAVLFVAALLHLLLIYVLRAVRLKRAQNWPKAWATIHSADLEVMELDKKSDIMLPCFTFSYVVAEEEYSGRFSLFSDGEEEGESLAKKLIDRKIELHYDPKRHSTWYIPDKQIDGYKVEQKMNPHFFHEELYPKD